MNVIELQIQHYEVAGYGSAGYGLLRDIANALGVGIPTERAIRVAD